MSFSNKGSRVYQVPTVPTGILVDLSRENNKGGVFVLILQTVQCWGSLFGKDTGHSLRPRP